MFKLTINKLYSYGINHVYIPGQDRKKKKGKQNLRKRDAYVTESVPQLAAPVADNPPGGSTNNAIGGGDSTIHDLQKLLEQKRKELEEEKKREEKKSVVEDGGGDSGIYSAASFQEASPEPAPIKNEPVKKGMEQ